MSPRLLCATVKEANLPTIVGHFQEYLKRPDVIERMKPWDAVFDGLAEALRFLREEIAAVQRVAEAAPSLGYERMLGVRGVNPILARLMARLLVRRGTRIADESKWFPRVAEAICFLAKPGRRRRAFVRKVQFLLRTWDETSIIETIFTAASLDDFEFVRALQLAADGDEGACRRVTEIAATIAPHASIRCGPKVSAPSAAHEFLLEEFAQATGSRAYTWREDKGMFTDPLTEATRLEFDDPRFDPRPAYRRVKARAGAKK
jgi:hypothetical protein